MTRPAILAACLALAACNDGNGAAGFVPLDTVTRPDGDAIAAGDAGFDIGPDVDLCETGPVAGEPCLYRTCDAACECVVTQLVDGTACDGGACLVGPGECSGGACVGESVDCDDGEPCTDDGCDRERGCVYAAKPKFTHCDTDPCHVETCSEDGVCYSPFGVAVASPCGDGLLCDEQGACAPASSFSLGLEGEPCEQPGDCASGLCTPMDGGAVCGRRCYRGGADCDPGWMCVNSACVPSDYGAECASDADCGGQCASASAAHAGYCTNVCVYWSCPDAFACEALPELSKQTGLGFCVPLDP